MKSFILYPSCDRILGPLNLFSICFLLILFNVHNTNELSSITTQRGVQDHSAKASILLTTNLEPSFSHYFNENNLTSVYNDAYTLGVYDAQHEGHYACGHLLTILDFGEPYYWSSNGSDVYGVLDYVYGIEISYANTSTATANYINGWLSTGINSTCHYLGVEIGTNNGYICPGINASWCYYWNGYVLEQTAASLNSQEPSVSVFGGSDIETDPGFNNYSVTIQWLQGYYAGGSGLMFDYGDACRQQACYSNGWNACDIYTVAWGYGYDEPIPEVYVSSQPSDWAAVENPPSGCASSGHMTFSGIANESWFSLSWVTAWNDFVAAVGSGYITDKRDSCFPRYTTIVTQSECYNAIP